MTQYCTTVQVFDLLSWTREVPEFIQGETPCVEEVKASGVSTASDGDVLYLNNNRLVNGTLVLAYGADEDNLTDLALTTDYTVDLDKGKITLTSTGATTIGTGGVFAREYEYVQIDGRPGIKDSVVSTLIDRATQMIDEFCNQTWQAAQTVVREEHVGKGYQGRMYRPFNLQPLIVDTLLDGVVDNSTTTFTLDTTTGLVAGQYMTVEDEIVKIDSVDSATQITVTRGQLGSSAAAHADNSAIINVAVEVSNTPEGSVPAWQIAGYPSDFEVLESGMFQLLYSEISGDGLYVNQFPVKGLGNRARLTYAYGTASAYPSTTTADVPDDVEQACIFQVMRWITTSSIAQSLMQGIDGFAPTAQATLSEDIQMLLRERRLMLMSYS